MFNHSPKTAIAKPAIQEVMHKSREHKHLTAQILNGFSISSRRRRGSKMISDGHEK